MNVLKIKETCIYTTDLEGAKKFYHGLLGLPVISYVPDKYIFFRAGASVLLCFNPDDSAHKKSPPSHHGRGKLHFAFEVSSDQYYAVKEYVNTLAIPIIDEVTWSSGKKSFYFEDPFGNVLEILPDTGIWD